MDERKTAEDSGKTLESGAAVLGYAMSPGLSRQFQEYMALLLRWNKAYNLTSITEPGEIVVKHFLDSLLFLKELPLKEELRVFDLGSGAGFPGLPMKLLRPDLHVTLVEPSRKKCSFLRAAIRVLGLAHIEVVQERSENVTLLTEADVVVSRALFKIREIQEILADRVPPGCRVILSKGPQVQTEVAEAKYPVTVRPVRLPVHDVDRWLIIWITQ